MTQPSEIEAVAPESFSAETLRRIKRAMIFTGITQRQIASRMGVTEARVSQMLGSNGNMTLKTVDRVLAAISDERSRS